MMRYIEVIEECRAAAKATRILPTEPGDVPETYADHDDLVRGGPSAGDAMRLECSASSTVLHYYDTPEHDCRMQVPLLDLSPSTSRCARSGCHGKGVRCPRIHLGRR